MDDPPSRHEPIDATAAVQFDGRLDLLPWGRRTYTVLRIPDELVVLARSASTRRVEGILDEVEVNLGLNRADVIPDNFVYVGAALQSRLSARAGDVVRCRLAPADPDHVPLPTDVATALEAAGALDAFECRPAPERRRLLAEIENAVRPETHRRRLRALAVSLTR